MNDFRDDQTPQQGPAQQGGHQWSQQAPQREPGFFGWLRSLNLPRSEDHWVGGVAGGIAQRITIDPLIVRGLLIVVFIFTSGPLVLVAYALAWALLPDRTGRIHGEAMLRGQGSSTSYVLAAVLGAIVLLPLLFGTTLGFINVGGIGSFQLGEIFGFPGWLSVTLTVLWGCFLVGAAIWLVYALSTGRFRKNSGATPPPRGAQPNGAQQHGTQPYSAQQHGAQQYGSQHQDTPHQDTQEQGWQQQSAQPFMPAGSSQPPAAPGFQATWIPAAEQPTPPSTPTTAAAEAVGGTVPAPLAHQAPQQAPAGPPSVAHEGTPGGDPTLGSRLSQGAQQVTQGAQEIGAAAQQWGTQVGEQATQWGTQISAGASHLGHQINNTITDLSEKAGHLGESSAATHRARTLDAAHIIITLGVAFLAGGLAAVGAYRVGYVEHAITAGLVAGLSVIGLSIIIAGVRGKTSGWLGFTALLAIVTLSVTTLFPAGTQFRAISSGAPMEITEAAAGATQGGVVLVGTTTLDLRGLDDTGAALGGEIVYWLGAGNTTVLLPETVPVDLRVSGLAGRIGVETEDRDRKFAGPLISYGSAIDSAVSRSPSKPKPETAVTIWFLAGNIDVVQGTENILEYQEN